MTAALLYSVKRVRSCRGCPGWPPMRPWPARPDGRGGFVMSMEGGLEKLDEFLDRRATRSDSAATCAVSRATSCSNSAMRACCRRIIRSCCRMVSSWRRRVWACRRIVSACRRMTCPGFGCMVRLAEAFGRLCCHGYRTVGGPTRNLTGSCPLHFAGGGGYNKLVIRLIGNVNGRKAVNGYVSSASGTGGGKQWRSMWRTGSHERPGA